MYAEIRIELRGYGRTRPKKAQRKWAIQFISERDGWDCWICGCPIDPNITDTYHDEYVTLDHVVDFSKGGMNTVNNLKLAHQICNRVRGNNFQSPLWPKQKDLDVFV